MRTEVTLVEAFDNPFPYRWTLTHDTVYAAEFRLPDGTPYIFQFLDQYADDIWEVSFSREARDGSSQGYAKRYGLINLGNPVLVQRLFATCIAIMAEFVKRTSPAVLEFTAENDEPSRVKLYTQMLKLVPRSIKGYKAEPPRNGGPATQFRIVSTQMTPTPELPAEGTPF